MKYRTYHSAYGGMMAKSESHSIKQKDSIIHDRILDAIQKAIVAKNYRWTSKRSIIIYLPEDEDIKYIALDADVVMEDQFLWPS